MKLYTPLINKALNIAYNAHHGQFDASGVPYIYHPAFLAAQMDTEDEIVTALLHDVVEDTPVTFEDLEREGFSRTVTDALTFLTHKGGDYEGYISRVESNPLAVKVKLADLRHNGDAARSANLPPRDAARYMKKYAPAIRRMEEAAVLWSRANDKPDWIPAGRYYFDPALAERYRDDWPGLTAAVNDEIIARYFHGDGRLCRQNVYNSANAIIDKNGCRRLGLTVLEIDPPRLGYGEPPHRLDPRAMAAVLCAFTKDGARAYTLPFRPSLVHFYIGPPRLGYFLSCGANFQWERGGVSGGEGLIIQLTLSYYDNPDIHDHISGYVKMWFRFDPERDLFIEADAETLRAAALNAALDGPHMLRQAEEQEAWFI